LGFGFIDDIYGVAGVEQYVVTNPGLRSEYYTNETFYAADFHLGFVTFY